MKIREEGAVSWRCVLLGAPVLWCGGPPAATPRLYHIGGIMVRRRKGYGDRDQLCKRLRLAFELAIADHEPSLPTAMLRIVIDEAATSSPSPAPAPRLPLIGSLFPTTKRIRAEVELVDPFSGTTLDLFMIDAANSRRMSIIGKDCAPRSLQRNLAPASKSCTRHLSHLTQEWLIERFVTLTFGRLYGATARSHDDPRPPSNAPSCSAEPSRSATVTIGRVGRLM
ncbi:hypothetical protein KZ813_19080 [Sphingomonas sp. RHCKR7]|uniref:hypothetical protein n=1 Tax=Sphingomonas folli TaxID=2862497 RepID=UPI001CA48144|nr:hypothetical protein [Sphingomonas folli]MBW6528949.1 hypothetical protein [Sphingomonas folli]